MEQIPNLLEFLQYLAFLRGEPSAYLVMLTAAIILIIRDWRWSLMVLLIQYLVVGLLFADLLPPHLSFMKVIVGLFATLILYLTARQVNWGDLPADVTHDESVQFHSDRFIRLGPYMLPTDTPFRVFLAILVVFSAWALAQNPLYPLPAVPQHLNLAIYALACLGLVKLSLTSEPLKAGIGLLTMLTGFELFYSALEQSVAMIAFLALVNLMTVVAITYLTQARHTFPTILD